MTGIFGLLEPSAMQWYQDVAPTQEFFPHRHIYSLWQEHSEHCVSRLQDDCIAVNLLCLPCVGRWATVQERLWSRVVLCSLYWVFSLICFQFPSKLGSSAVRGELDPVHVLRRRKGPAAQDSLVRRQGHKQTRTALAYPVLLTPPLPARDVGRQRHHNDGRPGHELVCWLGRRKLSSSDFDRAARVRRSHRGRFQPWRHASVITRTRGLQIWRQKRKLASWEAKWVQLDRSWLPLPKNPDHHPPKNEPFSQEMHLKIPRLCRGLKFSNSKPGCRVSALHFFVK